jgi:hypothetical protein
MGMHADRTIVREYHATYYVPHNLTLIVCGKLASGTASLLDVVQQKIEPTLIEHGQKHGSKPPGWKRPFVETASADRKPLTEDKIEVVEFPEKDESVGELTMSFVGPHPTAFLERKVRTESPCVIRYLMFEQALDVIGTYMTSSATAPLNKEYIEIESPLWWVLQCYKRDPALTASLAPTSTLARTLVPQLSTCPSTSDRYPRPSWTPSMLACGPLLSASRTTVSTWSACGWSSTARSASSGASSRVPRVTPSPAT